MDTIKQNTLVSMSIKIEDENANILDDSDELIYLHGGYKQIFQKLEEDLDGKKVGDTFDITLDPVDAFGEYDKNLVVQESLKYLPDDIEVGTELDGEEEGVIYVIESIENGSAVLNANHELAGISLRISGEILELEQLSSEGVQEILKAQHEH